MTNGNELSPGERKNQELRKLFGAFSAETKKPDDLTVREKQLISVALSVVKGCEACIESNVLQAREGGVSEEEIVEACLVAVKMDGAPAMARTRVDVLKVLEAFRNGARYVAR